MMMRRRRRRMKEDMRSDGRRRDGERKTKRRTRSIRRAYGYVWKFSTHSVTPLKGGNNDGDETFLERHALSILPLSTFWDTPISSDYSLNTQDKANSPNLTAMSRVEGHKLP